MGNKISKIKKSVAAIIIIEIILMVTFVILYFVDPFPFKFSGYFKNEYLAIAIAAIIFFNSLFIWINYLRISKLRGKTDLFAAEVIGGDVQEAYNFGQIGLAITDEKQSVIWTNDLFSKFNIIDSNILDWNDGLKKAFEEKKFASDQIVKINIGTRIFQVKLIEEAGLWIFKDITDHEEVVDINTNEAPVVGVISIDNYAEIVHGEDDFNDTATKVKNIIFDYARKYNVLLRKNKDYQYTMVCNYKNLNRMISDKFSLLDEVRSSSSSQEQRLTLSVGIAHHINDFVKLNELANECLNFAASRGGDQVVVNTFGSGYSYFGGTTEASESSSRIDIRTDADTYLRAIDSASNVLVMGHIFMDMDSLGACLGIKAMCDRQGVHCDIVIDLKKTEAKTRGAITSSFTNAELSKFVVTPKDALSKVSSYRGDDRSNDNPDGTKNNEKKKTGTLLFVVDVNVEKNVMAPDLLPRVSKIIVIDHHRAGEGCITKDNATAESAIGSDYNIIGSTIDPSAASTCELIAEYINFSSIYPKIELSPLYATIMLSGIFLDSRYYKSKATGYKTFEASTILKDFGADNYKADDFLKDDFEEHRVVNKLVAQVTYPITGIAIACDNNDKYDNVDISKASDVCLSYKSTMASFVIARTTDDTTKISARSDGTLSVQLIMEKLNSMGANGGGHLTMASASFNNNTPEQVKEILLNVIKANIEDARHAATSLDNEGGK